MDWSLVFSILCKWIAPFPKFSGWRYQAPDGGQSSATFETAIAAVPAQPRGLGSTRRYSRAETADRQTVTQTKTREDAGRRAGEEIQAVTE